MKAAGVFFLSLLTSVLTSGATVVGIERFELLPQKPVEVPKSPVPELKGLSEADARANLAARRLVMLIAAREASADAAPGHVLSQSIAGGTPVPLGEAVTVTLAAPLPTVPKVTGLTVDDAKATLEKAGYRLAVGDPVVAPDVPEGQITTQAPEAEAPLAKDGTVTVRVSKAPAVVEIPKVVGLTMDAAKKRIEDGGLSPTISWISVPDRQAFLVMRQDPLGGKELEEGSTVKLFVNK